MRFRTWFTKANKDGTVRGSADAWIESQNSFAEFLDAACGEIFGEHIVPEINWEGCSYYDVKTGTDLLTKLRGSCAVKLTVNGPSKDINKQRHPVASEMTFHWEVDDSRLHHMMTWVDDDNAVTSKPSTKTELKS